MVALFIGGPLDCLSFTNEQINQVAEILPTYSESGHRNFLLMPSPADCTRILRGEITKRDCQGQRSSYEQLRKADGSVEYHEAGGGVLGHALRQKNAPLSEEQEELKQMFAASADRFIEQLRSAGVTADTDVCLVRLFRDRQGNTFRAVPVSIAGKATLTGFDPETAKRMADAMALDTAIGNINSLVRHAPTDYVDSPGHPSNVLQVYDFELLIGNA